MISSLHKQWSSIVRLLPCASSLTPEKIYDIVKACSRDVEEGPTRGGGRQTVRCPGAEGKRMDQG